MSGVRGTLIALLTVLSGSIASSDLRAQDMPRGGERRRFADQVVQYPLVIPGGPLVGWRTGTTAAPGLAYPGAFGGPGWYGGYGGGYYGTPWFIPQTQRYKYPVPQYETPRLGLQYLYPNAYQFGIVMPPDPDEPVTGPYPYPPFANAPVLSSLSMREGMALMKKGQYADAGRRFARELKDDSTPPEVYLMLSTALFALGKLDEAELSLRQAIDTARDLDFLDRADLPGTFPNADALKQKLGQFGANDHALLKGTFLLLAGERDRGLDTLKTAATAGDAAARRVYLHFLGSVFGPEQPAEPKPAAPSQKKA